MIHDYLHLFIGCNVAEWLPYDQEYLIYELTPLEHADIIESNSDVKLYFGEENKAMNLRPMIIGDDEILALQKLKEYAEKNVFSFDDLLDIKNGDMKPPGEQKEFKVMIPFDYYIVFTIEEQPAVGKMRHLSMSVGAIPTKGIMPNPAAVKGIMTLLGFKHTDLEHCRVFIEQDYAVNVMEKFE